MSTDAELTKCGDKSNDRSMLTCVQKGTICEREHFTKQLKRNLQHFGQHGVCSG